MRKGFEGSEPALSETSMEVEIPDRWDLTAVMTAGCRRQRPQYW